MLKKNKQESRGQKNKDEDGKEDTYQSCSENGERMTDPEYFNNQLLREGRTHSFSYESRRV
jgi:hypothetical protein